MTLDPRTRPPVAHHGRSGTVARSIGPRPQIRRELLPGDIGAIAAHHGRLYGSEFGVDVSFEADLARALYEAAELGWPRERGAVWIVEWSGSLAGSLALTPDGEHTGRVRAFLLDPSLRGQGLGARLLDELLQHARGEGYELLRLATFSALRAAAHLYLERGFALVSSETGPRWGMERMTYQGYELELPAAR